ncbi:Rrf2 family transcriptional regulator [bacterium]|nr:Rrf2 family transcriptional regulator [bacterium]
MMRISTKGRYGARLMLELALHYEKGTVLLKDIAKRQEISEGYLEHIVPILKSAGLISSSRGAHGGYTLARNPSDITFKDIVGALEGNLAVAECVSSPKVCHRVDSCVTREIWEQMSEKITEVLASTILEDIVKRHREKQQQPLMYSI